MILQLTLQNEVQGHIAVAKTLWPLCKAHLHAGRQLVTEVRFAEDLKTDKQRKFYHGYVLVTIAAQAQIEGRKFAMKVWKEYFREKYLGYRTVTHINPRTGKKSRRRERQSTERLGVKGYSDLIEKVIAEAVTELGVEFLQEWTDPETGEVFQLPDPRQRQAAKRRQEELGEPQ